MSSITTLRCSTRRLPPFQFHQNFLVMSHAIAAITSTPAAPFVECIDPAEVEVSTIDHMPVAAAVEPSDGHAADVRDLDEDTRKVVGDAAPSLGGTPWAGLVPPEISSVEAANDAQALLDDRLARVGRDSARRHVDPEQDDRAAMRLMFGPRLIAARELAGLSQTEAAEKFGYKTPAQLSLWEMGRRMVPLHQLHRAASIYGVSADFLLSLSSDPERDASRARRNGCVRTMRAHLSLIANNIADMIDGADNLAGPNAQHFRELLTASRELTEATAKFHRLNVAMFEDARGGATVLAAAERLGKLHLKCSRVLAQHDEEARAMTTRLVAIRAAEQEGRADDET